jgi:hypothetical protein
VTAAHVSAYLSKAEEYLAAATNELNEGRSIAATSLAIHAAINASDAVTGVRLGRRAAGEDHDQFSSCSVKRARTEPRWSETSVGSFRSRCVAVARSIAPPGS